MRLNIGKVYGEIVVLATYCATANIEYLSSTECANRFKNILETVKEYKHIEEEIGIDLTIFIKFLKYGGYMKTPLGIEKIKDGNIDFKGKLFYVSTELPTIRILTFKDYRKTWALTKEELL